MKRILFALSLVLLGTVPAFAQSVGMPSVGGYWSTTACGTGPSPCFVQYGGAASGATDSGSPVKVGGVYNSSLPTFTTGQRGDLQVGSRGSLHVEIWGNDAASAVATSTAGDAVSNAGTAMYSIGRGAVYNGTTWDRQRGDTTGTYSVGNVAASATDSGNPVKVGGVNNTTPPTLTNGQRGDLQLTTRGEALVRLSAAGAANQAGNPSDALANGIQVYQFNTLGSDFNGATWDRSFTCPSSATVSVTAAATTQIVALSASTIIRVCSFTITGSAAATAATWVYGTGASCATGQVALTGAMLMPANGSIVASGMNGSLFRGAAGNALCLTAATGNVTGFVTYAQY